MLEKQEYAPREEARDGAPRLPLSLSGEINSATRTLHTNLNRLITSRLPLALPPYTTDPSLYTTGLLHFAHIFLTFESLWADLLRDYAPSNSHSAATHAARDPETASPFSPLLSYLLVNPYDSPSLFTSTLGAPTPPSPQLAAFLQSLRPRGLIRSGRLKRDLEHLLGAHPTDLEVLLAKYPGDKVADFCTHIRKSVNEKPWTLVSYAWCFYMAIFSGGRWIRGGLLKAPPGFWPPQQDDANQSLQDRGLSFWHFPGPHDGEDIKAEFKLRLADAEDVFTPDERVDIIEEAKEIFRLCASLVDELDEMVGTSLTADETNSHAPSEKHTLIDANVMREADMRSFNKSSDPFKTFLRRPEVTGTLVAMGCLACVALFRLQ
ncbi:heme oxygenase-like protein [Stemphylium lycopersici]|uniref:Heme oxygenase-like protein n=1 Tax=Stemphylium lycopersici TaxID=183478 RepID=A0A364NDI2_STELY|nr:heme oxygenase-like protein [Stemphylium lycopersici]RAR00124.1 heme oxygenase-like protein [Stemphylium lycopersici]RAR15322.1 heme oxygenase-like protein [Stemphylium lycopersici]